MSIIMKPTPRLAKPWKKRTLAVVLTLCLVITMMPLTAITVHAAGTTYNVGNETQLADVFDNIKDDAYADDVTINLTANINYTGNILINGHPQIGDGSKDIIINLNTFALNVSGEGQVVLVGNGSLTTTGTTGKMNIKATPDSINSSTGLSAKTGSSINITGDIIAENGFAVSVSSGGEAVINGNVTGYVTATNKSSTGLSVSQSSKVTVNGNVSGENFGVLATNSEAFINGSVTATGTQTELDLNSNSAINAYDNADVTVTGNVVASGVVRHVIRTYSITLGGSRITVKGNVIMNGDNSATDGVGIAASVNGSVVKVTGDVSVTKPTANAVVGINATSGAEVSLEGNLSVSSTNCTGVSVNNDNTKVTVDGKITSTGKYVEVNGTVKNQGDFTTPTTKEDFLTYNHNASSAVVWVKELGGNADTTAPVLSSGHINRTSDTAANIGFTTNEAGTAYYLMQNSGATAPSSVAVKAGTSLGSVSGIVMGKAVTLTTGAKDIYVVVEDTAGNISTPLKITAAAYQNINNVINITKIDTPLKTVYVQSGKSFTVPVAIYDGTQKIDATLTWKSSNSKIKVNVAGKISVPKSTKKGSAIITAIAANDKLLVVKAIVSKKAVKLKKFTVSTPKSMTVGQAKKLTIKLKPAKATLAKVTFKSSKPGGLAVDKAGNLTSIKKGTYKITITVNNKTVKKTVIVK